MEGTFLFSSLLVGNILYSIKSTTCPKISNSSALAWILDKCFFQMPPAGQPFLASDFFSATKTMVGKRERYNRTFWPLRQIGQVYIVASRRRGKARKKKQRVPKHPSGRCTRNFSMSNGNQFRRKHVVDAPNGMARRRRGGQAGKKVLSAKSLYGYPT